MNYVEMIKDAVEISKMNYDDVTLIADIFLANLHKQKQRYIDVIADRTGLDKSTVEDCYISFTDDLFNVKIKSQLNGDDVKVMSFTETTKD